jgi:RES domain-containing protein
MRRAWRLVRENNAKDAFTGEGARIAGGRWNHKEIALVYTSETLSLATLELLVHLKRYEIKFSLVYFLLEVPDSVPIEEISQIDLPSNWRTEPPPNSTKQVGTEWVKRGSSAVLRVPSILIPIDCGEYAFRQSSQNSAKTD